MQSNVKNAETRLKAKRYTILSFANEVPLPLMEDMTTYVDVGIVKIGKNFLKRKISKSINVT